MKILLICDDFYHPGEVVSRGLQYLSGYGHTVDTVTDKTAIKPETLGAYDAVVIAKGNRLTKDNEPWFEPGVPVDEDGYRRYIEAGGALLMLHSGTTFRRESCPKMTALMGLRFLGHPAQCPVRVHVADPAHPIAEGVEDFTLEADEHYQLELLDERSRIVFETVSDAGTQPGGLTREIGAGRMCVLTPGHNDSVFENPGYRKIIANALEWITGKR